MSLGPRCSLCRLPPYTAALAGVEALVEDRPAFRLFDACPTPRINVPRPAANLLLVNPE
jgi:hypothetical protein